MAEPTDAVMPILRRIQSDLAETKRDLGGKIDSVIAAQLEHGEALGSIDGHLTFSIGIQQCYVADLDSIKEQIAEMKRRIAALEKRK